MPYKNKEDKLQRAKKYREQNRDEVNHRIRNSNYKKLYGITIEDFDRMYNEQNGCCAICKRHSTNFKKRLCVDHNHITGKARQLLCDDCNQAIGRFQENIEIMQEAINYIRKHNNENN